MDKKDKIILQQLDVIRSMTENSMKRMNSDFWGTPFENVTGDVRCKLYKGCCHIVGRRSPYTLYDPEVVTFEADDVYNQQDATGFIKLNALRLRINANARKPEA